MASKGVWRIWGPKTTWNNWQWIGGYGGGYAFHYKDTDMNGVPRWVRDAFERLLRGAMDMEGAASSHCYYELAGKSYKYRIVPLLVEHGAAKIDILRHKKTIKGAWCAWDENYSLEATRRNWEKVGLEKVGLIEWRSSRKPRESDRRSTMQGVPKWVQNAIVRLLDEEGSPVYDNSLFYKLIGKTYTYRILPTVVETRKAKAEIFRRTRKTATPQRG